MNLKMCEIVTDADKLKVDLQATIMKYSTIKHWAYILHDKDDTRSHYHIALHFGGASVDTKLIAEWFNLGYVDKNGVACTGEQFVERVKCRRWSGIVTYLIHGQESQQNKHQYSSTEVHANFNVAAVIGNEKILGHFEQYSYADQLAYVESLPPSERKTAFNTLETLWKCHCKQLSLNTERQVSVVFITGEGGTGKTYYAKEIVKKKGWDYCISSSSNDPWQDYLGQKVMILDDLRDKSMSFEDLLKCLDNNTSSSVKRRFSNVIFIGEMIIITSSIPLNRWYRGEGAERVAADDLKQLYRRIGTYCIVSKNEIEVYSELDDYGNPKGGAIVLKNKLAEANNSTSVEKLDVVAMFRSVCEPADSSFETEPIQLCISDKKSK